MTKDLKTIDLNLLPIETLAEMANDAGEQVENNAKLTVQKAADCGRYLTAIKEQLEHGKWLPWLGANWNYTRMTATRYMEIGSNVTRMLHLKDASSINEALRMIADDKEEKTAPRSERKPANVVVTTPADPDDVGTVDDYPAADFGPCAADPAPAMPTTRKTAKGSETTPEAKKPRTQAVVAEIIEDEPESGPTVEVEKYLDAVSPVQVMRDVLTRITDDAKRIKEVRRLRKELDTFDPPTKFAKPDLDDVTAYFKELKSAAFADFFDYYESNGWLVGRVSMKDWRAAARKWARTNGSNGNGNRTSETTNLGSNGRPPVERAKIRYK